MPANKTYSSIHIYTYLYGKHFFLKKYMCKHIVGMAIHLKLVKPPPASKDVLINQKRKNEDDQNKQQSSFN